MSKAIAIRKSLLMKKQQSYEPEPLNDEERHGTEKLLRRFEALLDKAAGLSKEEKAQLTRLIGELRSTLAQDDDLKRQRAAQPPAPTIHVDGTVGAAANVGSGTTNIEGGVAGRDHKTITATTNIENAGTVIIPGDGQLAESSAVGKLERDYLVRLLSAASRVPLGQLELQTAAPGSSMPEIRLDSVYVPLDTTMTQRAVGGTSGERVQVPVLTAAIRYRWLVILGDPGSGKTTFINYLTMFLAGARLYPDRNYLARLSVPKGDGQRAANWRSGALLPVRVELREFAHSIPDNVPRGTADMVWKHIAAKLAQQDLGDFAKQLQHLLCKGECLVMFDGLDEVTDKTRRRLVREAVRAFAERYSETTCRFIVTCRVLSYTDPAGQLPGFPAATLAPLPRSSINTFIDNWYSTLARLECIEPHEARNKAEALRFSVSELEDLAQNPLLLTVMALVHTYKGTLPRERVRLYNDCVNLLLWDWQRAKQIAPGQWEKGILKELDTREERLITGLCEVAFLAHRAGGGRQATAGIPQSTLFRILTRYLDDDWGKAQRFGEYVEQRAGLLISRGQTGDDDKLYAFVHRGFQEFLAGRYIVAGWEFARRVADLAQEGDAWHEVLLLAVGHLVFNLQQIPPALDAINLLCKPALPKDETGWRCVWWAGEMLHIVGRPAAEQDTHVGSDLVPRVISQLSALVQIGHLPPRERAQAADVLGVLGDPRPGVCPIKPDEAAIPTMIAIGGGRFDMGAGEDRHRVQIKPFLLSRYPITNAQFRQFAGSGYNNDAFWTPAGREWRKRTGQRRGLIHDPLWGIDNRPVVGIAWYEAVAYANWLKAETGRPFRIPTEAEWERAASGPQGQRYPFGDQARSHIANIRETGIGQTTAVGIFPQDKTPEGVYDMGGNAWEWCSSLDKDYPYKAGDGRENPTTAGPRVVRGGGYDSRRETLHCTHRRAVDPSAHVSLIGFRVACDEK
jgi:formylglycine-generating enzyme required for sulfatase activity